MHDALVHNPEKSVVASGLCFAKDPAGVMSFVAEHGYHIEEGVWSRVARNAFVAAANSFDEAQHGTYRITQSPHQLHPVFIEAAASPRLVAMMSSLLRGPVTGLQSQWFYAPAGYEGYGLHQDNHFIRAEPDAFGTLWHAVDPPTKDNGGLVILPGSHLEGIHPVDPPDRPDTPSEGDQYVFRQTCLFDRDKYIPHRLEVQAGDVIFLHANLIHGSLPNRTDGEFRRSFVVTYLRAGSAYRAGAGNKRVPFEVAPLPTTMPVLLESGGDA